MTNQIAERSPLFYARLAGFLYLLIMPLGHSVISIKDMPAEKSSSR
jgi:hypothetical protein